MFKGARFQKRITIIPGLLRINLSKSGTSVSAGPQGADINIGKDGVTTNAGLPGTGLSYRQKLGGGKGMLGILLVIAGLGWWAVQHWSKVEKLIAPVRPAATQMAAPAATPGAAPVQNAPVNTASSALRYVHRQSSIIREEPKSSGKVLKKSTKGDIVTLIAQSDGWAKVTDGRVTGWMRASVWNGATKVMPVAAAARPSSRRSFAFAGPQDLLTRFAGRNSRMRSSVLGAQPPQ